MKVLILSFLLLVSFSGSSEAIVDPTPDFMGLFFDMEADVYCLDGMSPFSQVPLYLVFISPSQTHLSGVSLGVNLLGDGIFLQFSGDDAGVLEDQSLRYEIIWPEPRATEEITLLGILTVFYMDPYGGGVFFEMGSVNSPEDYEPHIQWPQGDWVAANSWPFASAIINESSACLSETAPKNFDSIKALYR